MWHYAGGHQTDDDCDDDSDVDDCYDDDDCDDDSDDDDCYDDDDDSERDPPLCGDGGQRRPWLCTTKHHSG